MKRLVFLLCTVIITLELNAQGRIGYTAQEIMDDFPNYTFVHGLTDDGTKFIATYDFDIGLVAYLFDEEGKSYLTVINPYTTADLSSLIEKYNSKYVRISDSKWLAYLPNGTILEINLKYDDKNGYIILIHQH